MKAGSRVFLVLALSALFACQGGRAVENARQALAAGQLIEAVEIVSRYLERHPEADAKTHWVMERIRLEALAKSKQGDQAFENLERLATTYPALVDTSLYLATAAWARAAGDAAGATRILDGGKKRFPQQASQFAAAIDEIRRTPGEMDSATVERLRSLGYLE